MRWLAALVVIAGCDRILKLEDVKYIPPDAPFCAAAAPSDDFDICPGVSGY